MGSLFKPVIFFITILFLSNPSSASNDQILNSFMRCLKNTSSVSDKVFTIYTKNNTSFETILFARIGNHMYSKPRTPKPLAIIEAKEESHVRTTVLCAKNHSLEVRVRSGGHDFEAVSSVSKSPFLILDMLNFRSIEIETYAEESAWVGTGATIGELYYKIANTSKVLAFPASICPGVGAGGHITGGGYGNLMRKYGLSSDNVVDAKIMDSNGVVRDRSSMGEDVFWALRGGGGASFGVVLSLKVMLVKVPEKVTVFHFKRSREQGGLEAINRWQYIAPNLPNEVFIRAEIGVVNGSIDIAFIGEFLGQSEELVSLLGKEFPELGLKPEECHEMSWVDSAVFWDNHPIGTAKEVLLNRLNGTNISVKIKSDYVQKPISKEGLESIWEAMVKLEKVSMKWNPYGGRMSEISTSESPFPHRAGNLFLIQYLAVWSEDKNELESLNAARELYEKMTPFVSEKPREAFLNYRDYDIGRSLDNQTEYIRALEARVYGEKYFKGNYKRLVKAKTKIDPQNFFRNGQSIPPLFK